MRSPSGVTQSGMRGREPVDSRIASAAMSSSPSVVVARTVWGSTSWPMPSMMRTPWLSSSSRPDPASLPTIPPMRSRSPLRSTSGRSTVTPIDAAASMSTKAPPVAIIALDGTQSHRCAAPPTMSRSISVTSAPKRAATVAAWVPAGPPPMITNRRAMTLNLLAVVQAPTLPNCQRGRVPN